MIALVEEVIAICNQHLLYNTDGFVPRHDGTSDDMIETDKRKDDAIWKCPFFIQLMMGCGMEVESP
ncbi:MAG: hypothetical protein M3R72_11195 [Bacteroidota bacterium]|nr:hypothetical protein [Bacteroidota bacterium]